MVKSHKSAIILTYMLRYVVINNGKQQIKTIDKN